MQHTEVHQCLWSQCCMMIKWVIHRLKDHADTIYFLTAFVSWLYWVYKTLHVPLLPSINQQQSMYPLLQVCPFEKMAYRHHYESPYNSTYITKQFLIIGWFWFSEIMIIAKAPPSVLYMINSSNLITEFLSQPVSFAVLITIEGSFALLIDICAHPYRQAVMCETILFPTSSSSSPTVWRCMPTLCRDFTKLCWMTSHRSEQFQFGHSLLHIWSMQT